MSRIKAIDFGISKMKVIWRVSSEVKTLFETESFLEAEKFCWAYDGHDNVLRIEKFWVKK